jgi:hypothetical protein
MRQVLPHLSQNTIVVQYEIIMDAQPEDPEAQPCRMQPKLFRGDMLFLLNADM